MGWQSGLTRLAASCPNGHSTKSRCTWASVFRSHGRTSCLSSAAPVHFEVESRAAGKVRPEACTDAEHYHVDRINATREWRVRAVADCETRTPVSKWSQAIAVTQYDSIYQRIKSKGQVDIFVSTSQDQDFFKWGDQGFDVDLAKLIVRDLSTRMGRELKLVRRPVSWEKLLPAADDASADLSISTITKTSEREKKFSIQFSDSYYCTTYALIYRAGTQEGQIRDMLKGKTVGVQRETTSADLADKLAKGGVFKIEPFDNTESLQNALVASRIDLGVTDTPFAQSAQLGMRLGNGVDRQRSSYKVQGVRAGRSCHCGRRADPGICDRCPQGRDRTVGCNQRRLPEPSRTASWQAVQNRSRDRPGLQTNRRAAAALADAPG